MGCLVYPVLWPQRLDAARSGVRQAPKLYPRNTSELADVLLDRGRFTRTESIAIAVASTAFALIFCYPLVTHLLYTATPNDWDLVTASQWAAYWTVRQYHQFPFWNAFECGGFPLLGDPQSHFLSPWFPLTVIFGPVVALHLEAIIYCAIAWAGSYALGRVLGMRRISAICTATAFAGSSWFSLRASEGHIVIMVFVYLPAILAAGLAASERGKLRYAAVCGALMALSFFEGSPYVPLYEALTLVLVLVGRAAVQLNARPLLALVVAGFFAAGFGAAKYAPAAFVMASQPRPTDPNFTNSVSALSQMLLSRNQDRNRPSINGWGFWESGAYVGLFAIIALMAMRFPTRAGPWIFAGIVLFELARGAISPNSFYVWLHNMPLFSSTRLPSRILIPFVLIVAVLAGLGIDAVCSRGSTAALAVAIFLVIVGGVDLFLVGTPNLRYLATAGTVDPGPPRSDFAQYLRASALTQSSVIQHHEGVVNCYVYTGWPTEALGWNEPGYRGEQYLLGPGSVTLAYWSPNRLEYTVDAPRPSVLAINQNYDPSWRIVAGEGKTFSQDGLLAVQMPAGKSRIVLRYVSLAAIGGIIISVLTALVALAMFRWEPRRPLPDAS
jgi:hypothetical protein